MVRVADTGFTCLHQGGADPRAEYSPPFTSISCALQMFILTKLRTVSSSFMAWGAIRSVPGQPSSPSRTPRLSPKLGRENATASSISSLSSSEVRTKLPSQRVKIVASTPLRLRGSTHNRTKTSQEKMVKNPFWMISRSFGLGICCHGILTTFES